MTDQIKFYRASRNDESVALKGDIIKVDWNRYSDGTPADNLTQGWNYNPFRTHDQHGLIMLEITEEEAKEVLQFHRKVEV